MSYFVARRFVDLFRPGDIIPAGHYPPATLTRMLEKGLVTEVNIAPDTPTEDAVVEPPAPRRIARKGRTGQL